MATSWAEQFHESMQGARLITLAIVGGLFTYAAGGALYTKVRPETMGTRATAVLLERYVDCSVVNRVKGQTRTREAMPCPEAEQMQNVSGSGKIGIRRDDMARLQVTLPDGSVHEARVAETKVRSSGVPLEGSLPVVFDRHSPDDVRAPVDGKNVSALLGILAFGLLLLAFPVVSVLNRLRGSPNASSVPERRESGKIAEARVERQPKLHAVQQPTVQPARVAAVMRRGAVLGPAGGPRTSVGSKA